jgi:hypothetical protein
LRPYILELQQQLLGLELVLRLELLLAQRLELQLAQLLVLQ